MKATIGLQPGNSKYDREQGSRLACELCCAVLFLAVLLAPAPVRAQTIAPWPTVSPEELAYKEVPGVPGASAVMLFREVVTDDDKRFATNYYRIKILSEQGEKYADVEISYLVKQTEIADLRARTVQPDGSVSEFRGQVFDRLIVKARKVSYQAKVFTLPEVKVGTIIEYAYTVRWKEGIPNSIKNPEQYVFTGSFSFLTEHWTVQGDLFARRARFALRPVPKGRLVFNWRRLPPERKPVRKADGTVELEVENVPALEEEDFMPPENTLRASVDLFYVAGFVTDIASFWRSQGRQKAEETEKFIGEPKKFMREVERIVAPGDSPETKLRKLYEFVQRIRYLSYEPSRSEKEQKRENLDANKNAEDVLRHRYAYANEINLLFVALARAAGFEAIVAEVTSRDSNFFAKEVLNANQLNAMVVMVTLNNQPLFLDPATRFCPFGLLPWEESDANGIRISSANDPYVRTTIPSSTNTGAERKAELKLDGDGALAGTLTLKYSGLDALSWRLALINKDEVGRKKEFEDLVKGWLPAGSTVEIIGITNHEAVNEPLLVNTRIQVGQLTSRAGRRMLLPAGIFQSMGKNPFQSASRVHPVYFRHPYRTLDDVRIELPPEFSVESLPARKSEKITVLSFDATYEKQEHALRFVRKLEVGGYYFETYSFSILRNFFTALRAADEQQVVLLPARPETPK